MGKKTMASGPRKRQRSAGASTSTSVPSTENELLSSKNKEKEVSHPHHVELEDFEGTTIYDYIRTQGWLNYVGRDLEVDPKLVLYFYKHFKIVENDDRTWAMIIRMENGGVYSYGVEDLANDFGLIDEDLSTHTTFWNVTSSKWPEELYHERISNRETLVALLNNSDKYECQGLDESVQMISSVNFKFLNGNHRLLLKILRRIIYPTNNKDNKVNLVIAQLMALVHRNVKINFPSIIKNHMKTVGPRKKTTHLPYGGLVTMIMRRWGIRVPGSGVQILQSTPINRRTFLLQKSRIYLGDLVTEWEIPYMEDDDRSAFYDEHPDVRRCATAGDVSGDSSSGSSPGGEQEARSTVPTSLTMGERIERLERIQGKIAKSQVKAARKQNKMMTLLRSIATACKCSQDDIIASHSSPDDH